MKIENLSPGQTVYSVERRKMGNTTFRTTGIFSVSIVSVDLERQTVTASWNHNPPREYRRKGWSKWRKEKPLMVKSGIGQRLATRAEIKAAKKHG